MLNKQFDFDQTQNNQNKKKFQFIILSLREWFFFYLDNRLLNREISGINRNKNVEK